jgi:hypothetical protein
MNNDFIREGFHQAVMFHGVAMLRRLRELSAEERMSVMQEASAISLQDAIWLDFTSRKFIVSKWDSKPITAAQVTALIVFGIWVQVGEDETVAAGLLPDWPELLQAKALGYLDP